MIWKTYTNSIKTRLITNVILIHAVLMGLVVFDMLEREHSFMNNQLSSKGYDLTEILASHTSNALLNNDLVALDELIGEMDNINDHYMVFIMDKDGRIRASQPAEYFNQTLTDSISRNMLKKLQQSDAKNIQNIHSQLIDTYSKIYVDNQLIGYARTILDARNLLNELKVITNKGVLYIILAILFGALFAWLSVRTMTANLNRVTQVANELSKNNFEIKLPQIKTSDEIGTLIKAFEVMQNKVYPFVKTSFS